MVSLSFGTYKTQACNDTSFIAVKVSIGSSDCEKLSDCDHVYIVIYISSAPNTPICYYAYNQSQSNYPCCIPSPLNYPDQICAKLMIIPSTACSGMTLDCPPACTQFSTGSYPIWGSKQLTPIPILITDFCLH